MPDTSYTRKETPDLDILIISRNSDRKIIKTHYNNSLYDHLPKYIIPVEVIRFDDDQRVKETESEEPTVLHTHLCSSSNISK